MGMWNGTCGLSHLPIDDGEAVVGYLILYRNPKPRAVSGTTFASSIATPASLGLRGVYDGYGRVRDFEDDYNVHSLSEEFDVDVEQFLTDVTRGKITVNYCDRTDEEPLGLWLVRRDVYDRILEMDFEGVGIEHWRQDAKELADTLLNHPASPNRELTDHLLKAEGIDLDELGDTLLRVRYTSTKAGRLLTGMHIDTMDNGLERYLRWWEKRLGDIEEDDTDLQRFVRDVSELNHLLSAMRTLRRDWQPRGGKGSQHFDWSQHRAFSKMVAELANRNEEVFDA